MSSGGDSDQSVMRVGGWGGLLAGIFILVGLLVAVLGAEIPATLREDLETFSDRSLVATLETDFSLAGLLLGITLLAALYVSLKSTNRGLARLGLGSGVFAFALGTVALAGLLLNAIAFSELYNEPSSDQALVLATYTAVDTLLTAGTASAFLFSGFSFAAFGFAMRGSPDYQRGLAWLTTVLGLAIVLFAFLSGGVIAIPVLAVLMLVLGWRVTGLARASQRAGPGKTTWSDAGRGDHLRRGE